MAVLLIVFLINYVQTAANDSLSNLIGLDGELRHRLAEVMHQLEGHINFAGQEQMPQFAVGGFTLAYYVVFPALAIFVVGWLGVQSSVRGLRLFSRAVAVDYALSMLGFVFVPVPERWSDPDSGAMLLSDRWSPQFIEAIRPFSGIDNCFPSFHTSLSVIIALVAFKMVFPLRRTTLVLAAAVVLSTISLGVHWVADVVAGTAVGILSVAVALRLERDEPASAIRTPKIQTAH